MVLYFINVGIFQLAFLLVYELLLKKETFFQANRWYLLIIPALGFLLPLLEIKSLQDLLPSETFAVLPEVWLEPRVAASTPLPENAVNWWMLIYILGLLVSLGLFIGKYLSLRKLLKGTSTETGRRPRIIRVPDSRIACTFLGTILLGDDIEEEEMNHILRHEMVHVRQRHSLDLIWFELLKIFFWFNPLLYLFQRRLSEVHEFIADYHAVKSNSKQEYFQQLLNTAFGTKGISFINQFFNHSLIKKRILMLQKKSKAIAKAKYLLLIPLLASMLIYVSCSTDVDPEQLQTQATTHSEIEVEKSSSADPDEIPFAIIEEVPIFPGCEDLASNEEKKACMAKGIETMVNGGFNTNVAKNAGLTGLQRMYVQFQITAQGQVKVMGARAPHPDLEHEAVRVVSELPNMQPGKQKGENVAVLYSLPIVLRLAE